MPVARTNTAFKSSILATLANSSITLAKILASGVELRPSLSELGRRIGRILKSERKVVLKDGRKVKSYDKLYSFSMVVEIAAAIARLEGCRAIEIRAGVKKERGPDLRVVSNSGEEILIEVTARGPSKHLDTLELPTSLDEFLKKVLEIDLERVRSKIEEQEKQLTQANCIIIAGWHTALGLAPLKHFAKLRSVQKVEELRGICMYSSWTSTSGSQNTLLCFPYSS